jgi:hypothetical protein
MDISAADRGVRVKSKRPSGNTQKINVKINIVNEL